MKKVVYGLAGIVLSGVACLSFCGCEQKLTINEEASLIRNYSIKIREMLGLKPEDSCKVINLGEKGEPLHIIIKTKEETKSIVYFDLDKDGRYDRKNTLEIPNKLDMRIIPPPKSLPKLYIPEKKKVYI